MLFVAYLAAVLIAVFYISPRVADEILTGACDSCLGAIFVVNPFSERLFQVLLLDGLSFLTWFFVLLALLAGIYLYLVLFHGKATYRAIRLPLSRISERVRSRSAIILVGQVFVAILFFDLVYFTLILPSMGIQPEPPPSFRELPEWYVMFSLVEAAFTEEVATRVLLIGAPLALGSLIVRLVQVTALPPEGGRRGIGYVARSLMYLFGGKVSAASPKAAQAAGAVLILLSAVFFGYLHVITWGVLWKFVDTFLGGLALGYLFLRRGLPASILLHFSINAFSVLVTAAGGEESLLSLFALGLFYLALASLGAGFFVFYVRAAGRFLLSPLLRPSKGVVSPMPRVSARQPGAPGGVLFPVACPNCGSREAIYEEGTLKCSACGRGL